VSANQIAAITYLKLFCTAGDKAGEGRAYNNIGICYEKLGDFKKAIEYAKKNLEIAQQTGEWQPIRSQD
jgi:tetratricopeptide (TPR) repeat protein